MKHTMILIGAAACCAAASLSACGEMEEHKHKFRQVPAEPAMVQKFVGNWDVKKNVVDAAGVTTEQKGRAVCELYGGTARIMSSDLAFELIFGIDPQGRYVLINLGENKDSLLVGSNAKTEEKKSSEHGKKEFEKDDDDDDKDEECEKDDDDKNDKIEKDDDDKDEECEDDDDAEDETDDDGDEANDSRKVNQSRIPLKFADGSRCIIEFLDDNTIEIRIAHGKKDKEKSKSHHESDGRGKHADSKAKSAAESASPAQAVSETILLTRAND